MRTRSPLRIAFAIQRKNYYRLLGPVIDEALARGHAVACWHDHSAPRGGHKGSEFPDRTPAFRSGIPQVIGHRGRADLIERWRVDPPDAVVSIDPPDPELRAAVPARWIWLQYGADILFQPTPRGVAAADAVALYGPAWIPMLERRFAGDALLTLAAKAAVVGAPEMDALARIDSAEVRRRLDLPDGRPVVLYLPFPLRSNVPTPWLRHVHRPTSRVAHAVRALLAGPTRYWPHALRGWNDRKLVGAMRAFCDATGAVLVMKARHKDPVPRYAERLADHVFYDPSHYPPTILELLSVAALCVHHYSTAVLEAAAAGVPSLCLAPAAGELGPASFGFEFVHNGERDGIYNAPGVAYWRPLTDAFDGAAQWRLDDFPLDPEARRDYVERFLGFDDRRSSARLLDVVERVVDGGSVPRQQAAPRPVMAP